MTRFAMVGVFLWAGVLGLAGCGDKTEPKAQIVVSNVAPPGPSTAADALQPRYEATLAEGIDFKKPGYPNFLAEVKGVSGYEPWGRWSDDKLVSFRFKQPLPEKFTLVVNGGAIGPNIGKTFKIKVGLEEKEIVFKSDPFKEPTMQRIVFAPSTPSDTIQITVPEPSQASNNDTRKLGLGMISLKIEN